MVKSLLNCRWWASTASRWRSGRPWLSVAAAKGLAGLLRWAVLAQAGAPLLQPRQVAGIIRIDRASGGGQAGGFIHFEVCGQEVGIPPAPNFGVTIGVREAAGVSVVRGGVIDPLVKIR